MKEYEVNTKATMVFVVASSVVIVAIAIYHEVFKLDHTHREATASALIMLVPIALFLVYFFLFQHGLRWVLDDQGVRMFRHSEEKSYVRYSDIVRVHGHRKIATQTVSYRIAFPQDKAKLIAKQIREKIEPGV